MTIRSKFLAHIARTSPFPLKFEVSKAEGCRIFDQEGKSYIDFISGIGVSNLGHANQHILKAIHAQTNEYLHTMVYGEHIQSPQVSLATLLTENLPISLDQVYFHSSGTEAIECALKLAKKYTGKSKIVACKNAYHGSTYGAMSLMSDTSKTAGYGPVMPNVSHIEFNNLYDLNTIDEYTAAVITEVIQAEAGIQTPDPQFLIALQQKCEQNGVLIIFDEIQTGMGRTGSLFAFQYYGITPDILVLGKSLGGGLPLSACIAHHTLMNAIADNPPLSHMTTFGGHPLSCAAGLASMQLILSTRMIEESRDKAAFLIDKIQDHILVKKIRAAHGLWMAIDLNDADLVQKIIPIAQEKGLLIDWFLFNDKSIRIAPPLNIEYPDLEIAARILKDSFDQVCN
ncbi:MAG: aminotransferase class III-fold pyridoxal phosphate-dependent enzyme [Saprospiraceae bacterium]